ncbi:MAG TPA: PVC-type heme-binding CxxCH protein [Verrucomicrobiae bacterium]|nr:PVC-type heme-binding CxxCH protein [Verrucomicrobiae bacterium]
MMRRLSFPIAAGLFTVTLVRISCPAADINSELRPREGLKPFEYMEAPSPLPNYVPDARWGTQGDPIRTMQKPLDPAESIQHLVTFPEFRVSLFAAEPDVVKPIWLAWDPRGRLWIAETVDYPNDLQSEGHGHDRLKICEDTDGDGRADKFTVFADQLSIPTGFVFANGGVIVIHSGRTEFFKDTDGDDKADQRRVLFTGWGMGDTHATASNLRYGFDNWIWGTVGYSGFHGTVGGKDLRFGQGIFRFKPDGSQLEFVRSSNNNTWGLGFTEDGLVFGSTANGNASMFMPIPNRYYEAVNAWSANRLETIADSQNFYPLTKAVRQVDYHGRYTAGAGSAIYTARSFPKEYWNRVQFVAEPTGHLLGKFHLESRGSDFVAHNGHNFTASDDEWTAPIAAEVGPDGALWLSDWYSYVVQHNPTPRGFRTGKGAAYETPLRDKAHGRIYRITSKNAKRPEPLDLGKATPQQLVAALKNDNLLWRMHAQRMLVERGKNDVVGLLQDLTRDRSTDQLGLNPAAIHALWTLDGIGALDAKTAIAALKHPSAAVRRAAAIVVPRTEQGVDALLTNKTVDDPDPQVRLATLLTLSEMPASEKVAPTLFAMLQQPRNSDDRWIPDGVTAAAARNDAAFLKAVLAGYKPATNASSELVDGLGRVVHVVTRHYAERGPVESIVSTLTALKGASPALAVPVLDGLVAGWPEDKSPALSAPEKRTLMELMQALPESVRDRLLALAQRWGQTELFGANFAAVVDSLKKQISDPNAADEQRVAAAKRLIGLNDKRPTLELLLDQINLLSRPSLATGFMNALAESRTVEAAQAVIDHWPKLTPSVRRVAIVGLLRRSEWARALLDAIEKGTLNRTDLAAEHWSQLKQSQNRMIAGRAQRLSAPLTGISADREEIVKKLLPLAKEKGDLARGKEVFAANCVVCHTLNGAGGKVGPDLTGISARDRSDILMEILDPNRSVEANYRLWSATTKDGQTFSGRLETETQTTVEILDTTAQKHVLQRKDIASLEASQLSIMPAGFESLPADDLKSLVEYLAGSGAPTHLDSKREKLHAN